MRWIWKQRNTSRQTIVTIHKRRKGGLERRPTDEEERTTGNPVLPGPHLDGSEIMRDIGDSIQICSLAF